MVELKKIKIAVIDSGFDGSQLNNDIIISRNFTDEESIVDKNGHGSCVIKMIDFLCKDVAIYNFKVLKTNNKGSLSSLKFALKEAIECDVNIINLSLGYNLFVEDKELNNLIKECIEKNIVVVNTNSNSDEQNGLNRFSCIFNMQGGFGLEKNTLYYSSGNYYMNNLPRIVPWINDSYIVTSANSFLTPYMVKYVCDILSENVLPLNIISSILIQRSICINSIDRSHMINFINREDVTNDKILWMLLNKIKKLDLYTDEGALRIKNLNSKSITDLVKAIEEITLTPFIIDYFSYDNIAYVENLTNRITNLLQKGELP